MKLQLGGVVVRFPTVEALHAGEGKMNFLNRTEPPVLGVAPCSDSLSSINTSPSHITFNSPVCSHGEHNYLAFTTDSIIRGIVDICGSIARSSHVKIKDGLLNVDSWYFSSAVYIALVFAGISYLPQAAAQNDDEPAVSINSGLPSGLVTLVGVFTLGFNAWLQGGVDAAPQVVRATRCGFTTTRLSGLNVEMSPDSNTFLTIFSFAHEHLASFIVDTAQRGFFHRKYCALVGAKEVQEVSLDELPSDPLPVNRLAIERHSTLTCCNTSSVEKAVLTSADRYHVMIPNAPSAAVIETMVTYHGDEQSPLFLVHSSIFPLRSLVYLPLRFWIDQRVLTEDEFMALIALFIRCPMDCFATLRQWFGGVDVWDWIKSSESSDASYMVARSLQCNDKFPFEDHDSTIPWPSKEGLTCTTCATAAFEDRAPASLAMVKVTIWFMQYAFYHEAFYHGGIVMHGDRNVAAADLALEIINNQSSTQRPTNSEVYQYLSRKGTFLQIPGYPLSIEHAASIAEIIAAFVLSMSVDPGIWVTVTLARQITVGVLVSESGRGLPLAQRWHWCCFGRFTPGSIHLSQGLAVWGYAKYNLLGAIVYGWLIVGAALAGTRLRNQAAQLQLCTNFGINVWIGWVAYGGMAFIVSVSLVLSLFGPSQYGGARAGPLAAEVSLLKLTLWRGARLFGMTAAVLLGALVLLYPSISWFGYLLEVVGMILWFGSEEYTFVCSYSGSAVAVAILASGLAGISRGITLKVPASCLIVLG
jgi:hypothetical protein